MGIGTLIFANAMTAGGQPVGGKLAWHLHQRACPDADSRYQAQENVDSGSGVVRTSGEVGDVGDLLYNLYFIL
jgi:hypothetical protein